MERIDIVADDAQLSRLLDLAAAGQEILIARAGQPVARLVPVQPASPRPRRVLGALAGRLTVPTDFDAPLPDGVMDSFEGR